MLRGWWSVAPREAAAIKYLAVTSHNDGEDASDQRRRWLEPTQPPLILDGQFTRGPEHEPPREPEQQLP